ncbi:hypothetical protein D3C71_1426760 [compost metagenome]
MSTCRVNTACRQATRTCTFSNAWPAKKDFSTPFITTPRATGWCTATDCTYTAALTGTPCVINPRPAATNPNPRYGGFLMPSKSVPRGRPSATTPTPTRNTPRSTAATAATCIISTRATNATTTRAATSATKRANPLLKTDCVACGGTRASQPSKATIRA